MPLPDDRIVYGRRPVLEALRAGAAVERVLLAQGLRPAAAIAEIRRRAGGAAVPVRVVPRAELDRLAGGNHQGVVAITGRYRYAALDDLLSRPEPCLVFLDGVTDPHNLGSLLRSADGAGFHGVVVAAHRSARVTDTVRRVSAGAAEVVPVARVGSLAAALERAKGMGLWIVGLDEQAEDDLWRTNLMEPPVGLVLGAEDRGLSSPVRSACDGLVRIPSRGRIGSLNVAVAGALAMFEVSRRRGIASATL